MSLLTQQDRDYILEQLRLAPDSVLADAMLEFNKIREMVVAVRKIANGTAPGSAPMVAQIVATPEQFSKDVAAYEQELAVKNAPRKNVSPGPALISKIGGNTKDHIFNLLQVEKQPPTKYDDHLKLLWARGEVKYDGEEYYL